MGELIRWGSCSRIIHNIEICKPVWFNFAMSQGFPFKTIPNSRCLIREIFLVVLGGGGGGKTVL